MLWLALSPLIPKPHKLASIDDDSLRPLSVSSTDSKTGLLQSDRRSPRRLDTILSTSSFGSPGSLRSFQLSSTFSYPSASAYSPSNQRSWGQQPELSFPPSLVPRQQEIRQFSNSPRGHMITLPALPQQPYRSLPSSPYLYRNSPRVPPRHAFSPGLASPSSASNTGTNARYAASDVQSLSPVSRTTTPSYPRTPSPLSLNVTEPVVPRKSLLPLPNPFVTYRLNGLQEYQDVRRFGSVSSLESGERTYYLHRGLSFDSTSSRSTTPRTS
ncbi:hypothetical protein AMATHDRAFT_3748 [Amanita thiersii Skay4041]|uniref:Uncharacterized protein n=1 Tax=Amanita thiersii Skay4041 TaxID=703135 RepID=A0A2A9NQS5_9AGAR|nr:hypothetical protein AMATHDRAFT_3748 [Amanita thiersii Skay4041]